MDPIKVFIAMVVVYFHSSAHTTSIKVCRKIDIEIYTFSALQGLGKVDFQESILDDKGHGLTVDYYGMYDGSELLCFVLAESDFGFVDAIQFIHEASGLNGILIQVKESLMEGVRAVVGIGELLRTVDEFLGVVQGCFDLIINILLPISLVGFFIFPVVWV